MSTLFIPRDGSDYTRYGDIIIEYRDASHRYWLHHDGERTPAVSVTSVLEILGKPALYRWNETFGIRGTVQALRAGLITADTAVDDAPMIVRSANLGAEAAKDEAAERGTAVHVAQQVFLETGSPPKLSDFEPAHRGYVQAWSNWLLDADPQPICVEQIVGSPKHGFAGRMDLRAMVRRPGTSRRLDAIIDLKSNAEARIYDESHLQAAGYWLGAVECGHAEPEGGLIVAVGADGRYSEAPLAATGEDFLTVLATYRLMKRISKATKDNQREALVA